VVDCNIEVELKDSELPFLGPASAMFKTFDNFNNNFSLRREIEDNIKNEAKEL
jgi:hypothetical protein